MADYPSSIFSPRTKQNASGVVYDPTKLDTVFVEDVTKIEDEVVSIETDLEQIIGNINGIPMITDASLFSDVFNKAKASRDIDNYNHFFPHYSSYGSNFANIVRSAVYQGTLFFLSNETPAKLHYIKFLPTVSIGEITLPADSNVGVDMIMYQGFLYAVFGTTTPRIVKIDPSSLEVVDYIDGPPGAGQPTCVTAGWTTLLVGLNNSPGQIIRIDTSPFAYESTATLDTGNNYVKSLFWLNDKVYIGLGTSPAKILKTEAYNFAVNYTYTADAGLDNPISISSDCRFIFVAFHNDNGVIVKLAIADITYVDGFTADSSGEHANRVLWDGQDIMSAHDSTPGVVYKIDIDTMTKKGKYTAPTGVTDFKDIVLWAGGCSPISGDDPCGFPIFTPLDVELVMSAG